MVLLTRPDGQLTAVNAVLVERVEAVPQTVVTLGDGTQYMVLESVPEVLGRMEAYNTSVLATTERLLEGAEHGPALRLLRGARRQ